MREPRSRFTQLAHYLTYPGLDLIPSTPRSTPSWTKPTIKSEEVYAMSQQHYGVWLAGIPRNDCDWFAFRVRPRHEKAVAVQLREKQQEHFLPVIRETRKWANRLTQVELPLFPGYIFGRTRRSALLPILQTAGIIDVVRAGSHPVPVDEEELYALKKVIDANAHIEPFPYIAAGERVHISDGPLAGLAGMVMDVRSARRLILSITLLNRSVLVELSPESIVRVHHAPVLEFDQIAQPVDQ